MNLDRFGPLLARAASARYFPDRDMLRMTKQADYGIVLMTRMARGAGNQRFTAPDLARETSLPLPTVSKILKLLARKGLLGSHRGVKGGYSLTRNPRRITVAAMISALDGPIAVTECIEDAPGVCSQESVCQLRGNWQRINLSIRQALDAISLAELTEPEAPLVQLGNSSVSGLSTAAATN
ncbi:MAG: SUF system Fe-S cluster assembly regulator [Thermoanaerobaculia bacterium]